MSEEEMTKEERIKTLESRVAELKSELNIAEWELDKARGSGPPVGDSHQVTHFHVKRNKVVTTPELEKTL